MQAKQMAQQHKMRAVDVPDVSAALNTIFIYKLNVMQTSHRHAGQYRMFSMFYTLY